MIEQVRTDILQHLDGFHVTDYQGNRINKEAREFIEEISNEELVEMLLIYLYHLIYNEWYFSDVSRNLRDLLTWMLENKEELKNEE